MLRIVTVIFCILTTSWVCGQFEEPDNLIYGTITGNGVLLTSADTNISVEVRITLEGNTLATYTMGDEESLGDFYRVKVPLKNDHGDLGPDELMVGDDIVIVVRDEHNDLSDVTYTTVERGRPVRLDLTFVGVCTQSVAGSDQEICGTSTTLEGNVPDVGTGSWSILSGDGGVFGDPLNPNTTFSGVRGETYLLQWLIHDDTFIDTMDEVTVLFIDELIAQAGPDQVFCATSGILAANPPSFGSGMWTIESGLGGSFDDISKADTTFYGQAGNTYILNWNLDNGHCDDSSDTAIIEILAPPEAGANQFVCGVSTILAAVPAVVGTGHWEVVSGLGGILVDPNDPTTMFQGIEGLSYSLNWIVSGTSCQLADGIEVTFSGLTCSVFVEHPVFCGIDEPHELFAQVRCGVTPYSYSWTLLSGPPEGGDFSDPAIPNPTFTPHGVGIYEIHLAIEDETGRSVEATTTIFAPDIEVYGQAGITYADFTYRLPHWQTMGFPPIVDVDENGVIDVRDFLVVLPCFDAP